MPINLYANTLWYAWYAERIRYGCSLPSEEPANATSCFRHYRTKSELCSEVLRAKVFVPKGGGAWAGLRRSFRNFDGEAKKVDMSHERDSNKLVYVFNNLDDIVLPQVSYRQSLDIAKCC